MIDDLHTVKTSEIAANPELWAKAIEATLYRGEDILIVDDKRRRSDSGSIVGISLPADPSMRFA
jgi:hypothetical protein